MPKRQSKPGSRSPRYSAKQILQVIKSNGGKVAWRDLVVMVDADHPKAITQLRQMLRGLLRTGELKRELKGDYFLPDSGDDEQGVVQRLGRTLFVGGLPINDASKLSLREGDTVAYRVTDDMAEVSDVLALSPEPVTGVLHWQGKYPHVEALGGMRGRVSLLHPRDELHADILAEARHGDTVQVQITERGKRDLVGIAVAVLDSDSVLDQAIQTAITSLNLPNAWPEPVDRAVARLPRSVQASRFRARRNLTSVPLVTIDGETAKDFDDAVFAESLKASGRGKPRWRLVVAIADVAHYVRPGSALDDEALTRGTSVYFPERVIPMLPEAISNELCSLKPHTPRLAMVCDMQIDAKGQVQRHEFYEAVIHSHARLTYTQVAAYMKGKVKALPERDRQAIQDSLDTLFAVFKALRGAREKRGALDFPTHEGALTLEHGRVTAINPVHRNDATLVIEEAMIVANVCAATFLEANHTTSLFRVHAAPDVTKLEDLRQALAFAGVRLAKGDVTPAMMQNALMNLPETANQWVFGQLALRSMMQAVYTPANEGHFGLALEKYMHFTSPIRRYPDLLVHRAIKSVLYRQQKESDRKAPKQPDADTWQWLGEQTSSHERRAESASWMVEGWLKCEYLSEHIGETFTGVIAAIMDFGAFIEIEGFYVQGLLHVSNLGSDYYHFNARSQSLVGERSGRSFNMGDTLEVIVQSVEPSQGKIDLLLAESNANPRARKGKPQERKGRNKQEKREKRSKQESAQPERASSGKQARSKTKKNKSSQRTKAKAKSKTKGAKRSQ